MVICMTMTKTEVADELNDRILYYSNQLKKTRRLLIKNKDKKALQQHQRDMINYYKDALLSLMLTGDENESIERDETIIIEKGRIYRDV